MEFNAASVIKLLESEYGLEFKTEEAGEGRERYEAVYDKRLEIVICGLSYSDGSGDFVSLSTWDRQGKAGYGIPCQTVEQIIKYIERYRIEKKKGYEQLKLF